MPSQRPTQAQVAQLAGVSRATVSYILNNRIDERIHISEETRQKVLKAAQELGYEPNALARSLRSGLTHVIGLLIPDTNNPHYIDILTGVQDEATHHDYYLVVVSASLDLKREGHCLRSLLQQRLDGLILAPTFADLLQDEIRSLLERTSPIVFVVPQEGAACVYTERRKGAEELMGHLISLGHKRIGFINGVARPGMANIRVAVYREEMAMLGMPVDDKLLRDCGPAIEDGYSAAQDLLDLAHPPSAIWTVNDLLAVGALHAVRERGLSVPEDISLAGFDDITLASHLYPPLTTVRMHGNQLGRRAAQVLFQLIQDPDRKPVHEVIHTELVVRQSTGPAKSR